MRAFEYREPETVEEALALLGDSGDEAKIIAGGTALVIMMKQRLIAPTRLISLRRLHGLNRIDAAGGSLRIGALSTHREVETSPLVRSKAPALSQTYRHVATLRVRNMATVGGSLAHADPSQDPPVTLIALGARLVLVSKGGSREIEADAFFKDYYETALRPDEMIREVIVPIPGASTGTVYLKYLPRTADDYATVGVAALIKIDPASGACVDCRIAMGCVGPTPIRAREAESLLRGQRLSPERLREAAAAAEGATDAISDARGSAEYKRSMAGVFVRRAVEQAWRQAAG